MLERTSEYQIVHFLHLTQSFQALERCGISVKAPYVLGQTGTDLALPPLRAPKFIEFLRRAERIVVYQDVAKDTLLEHYPELDRERIHTVLKAVELPEHGAPLPPQVEAFLDGRSFVLLPAHLRAVKGIETALQAFRALLQRGNTTVLLVAGKVLEADYAHGLKLREHHNVICAELSREQMVTAFQRASLVLNTSHVESSPNALLEALYLGRPVVARRIPGVEGLLQIASARLGLDRRLSGTFDELAPVVFFEEQADGLEVLLARCLANPTALAQMGESAQRAFAYLSDREREGTAYKALYDAVVGETTRDAVR
jgi:glycosyltransferase involved in cell wall biosynthesis